MKKRNIAREWEMYVKESRELLARPEADFGQALAMWECGVQMLSEALELEALAAEAYHELQCHDQFCVEGSCVNRAAVALEKGLEPGTEQ